MPVGRRRFLAAVSAPLLAGCNTSNSNAESVGTPTAVPVPTDRPTPQRRPPPDLSALGVEDAPELARGHRDSLLAGPHGFTREVVVTEDGTPIRTLQVRVRSTADAEAYHFVFDTEDTERYPTQPAEPYFETWDDGTTHNRYGRRNPEYFVSESRAFDSPADGTTDRFRIRRLFGSFASVAISETTDGASAVGTDLRAGWDVTPARIRLITTLYSGRFEATVRSNPLYVDGYDLSVAASISGQPVDIEATVDYERLDEPPAPPEWVETAKEEAE
jgi:hypothetical protein